MAENTLYFGDNLKILRDNIRDETVDLIYLDPPFNSKANYNVLVQVSEGPRIARANHRLRIPIESGLALGRTSRKRIKGQ